MTDKMPEEIWVFGGGSSHYTQGCWAYEPLEEPLGLGEHHGTPYRLKSTVDAERAADSKTIAALAGALESLKSSYMLGICDCSEISFDLQGEAISSERLSAWLKTKQALSDNALRIAETQEEK